MLTTEQARRLEISRKQPAIPDVRMVDQDGRTFRLGEWAREKNRFLIVDFVYTNCQSLCRALGTEFQQLQRSIVERGLQGRVHLLSLSFDPQHDSPAVMKQYADHMLASHDVWDFATVADPGSLDQLLQAFGVTVIPDRSGGFQHNAALIWIDPSGKQVLVTDYSSGDQLKLLDELAP